MLAAAVDKPACVTNVEAQHAGLAPVPAGLAYCLDGPADGSIHGDWMFFNGWVVPPAGEGAAMRVTVVADGVEVATLPVGQPRPDVEAALAPRPASGCGFSGDIADIGRTRRMEVRAEWERGSATIASINVVPTDRSISDPHDNSQAGEVTLLRHLVTPDFPRLVVDVGAHDGWLLSNSYPFIASGWDGVLVEPLPGAFDRLLANHRRHPRARCINVACSDADGTAPFFVGRDGDAGQNSTLSVDDNEWMRAVRSEQSIQVQVRRLSPLLSELGFEGDIGLLLIDCEGMDLEALSGMDPQVHRPWIVVTEKYPSNPQKEDEKHALLASWGLVHHVDVGPNEVWRQPFVLGG